MLKKFGAKFLILTLIGLMSVSDSLAQTRIRFARGRTSATVAGTIPADGTRSFVLGARAGQNLSAVISCGNGKCDFAQGALHDTQYSYTVEDNGDVYIDIHNHGTRSTRYTMTISIQ